MFIFVNYKDLEGLLIVLYSFQLNWFELKDGVTVKHIFISLPYGITVEVSLWLPFNKYTSPNHGREVVNNLV